MSSGAERPLIDVAMGDGATRPLKTSETVARDIVHAIVARGLRTGDKLPSEAAMLDEYSVSRESLREGLRLLEVHGLITIRRGPGGGPVVGRIDPANLGQISTLFYHLAGGTYEELFEACVITETTLAGLAARNPDRAAVKAAMQPFLLDTESAGPSDTVAAFVADHLRFHSVVASLARNRVLELALQSVGQIFTHHIVGNADPRDIQSDIERDHGDIARAITGGHVAKASSLMERHVRSLTDEYRAQMGDQMSDLIEWR
jgi:GntR family transcriptional repressor for pyruvate dehydrogenase complex